MNVNVDITVRDENGNIIISKKNAVLNTTTEECFDDENYTVEHLNMCVSFIYPKHMMEDLK